MTHKGVLKTIRRTPFLLFVESMCTVPNPLMLRSFATGQSTLQRRAWQLKSLMLENRAESKVVVVMYGLSLRTSLGM